MTDHGFRKGLRFDEQMLYQIRIHGLPFPGSPSAIEGTLEINPHSAHAIAASYVFKHVAERLTSQLFSKPDKAEARSALQEIMFNMFVLTSLMEADSDDIESAFADAFTDYNTSGLNDVSNASKYVTKMMTDDDDDEHGNGGGGGDDKPQSGPGPDMDKLMALPPYILKAIVDQEDCDTCPNVGSCEVEPMMRELKRRLEEKRNEGKDNDADDQETPNDPESLKVYEDFFDGKGGIDLPGGGDA